MRVPFRIGSKEFLITPYNTKQEKDILLLSSFDVIDPDRVLEILNFEFDDLTINEKKLILYKHREVSLGDEVNVKFKCDHCGQGNDGVLMASGFIKDGERNDVDVKKLTKEVTDDNLSDFVDIDVDELDISEFNVLKERVIANQVKVDFTKSANCLRCGTPKTFDMSSMKYIIEIMSDETLMTLYKTYSTMTYFGHYTKEDIDNMYPFERTIFIGILNKIKEDLNK